MNSRHFSILLVLTLAIFSCSSPFSTQQVSEVVPSATPFIAPSYPTAEALVISPNQVVSGIDIRVERAWQEGKQVYAEVCFTLPDVSDWTIWRASLNYDEVIIEEYGTTLLGFQEPTAGSNTGSRCDTLEFYVPPDANLSTVVINIASIASYPREGDYCLIYMPKIQQAFQDRGIAITLACNDVNGLQTMQIISKPEEMSQEDAEKLVYSDEFFTIKGPWEFTFNLTQ